ESPYVAVDSRVDLASFVVLADEVATKVLSEHRARLERDPQLREQSGDYSLSEYKRRISERTDSDRKPIVDVSYRLTTPHLFLGHPSHFNILVYKTSGETRVFGGR